MDIDLITNVLYAMVRTGTPLLIVALGEMVCEKSGVLNLGQEGMMLMGAVAGFIATLLTGNIFFGFMLAIIAGILMSQLFAVIALGLSANQVATGLALTIFGTGLSAFIGSDFVGKPIDGLNAIAIPVLSDIPVIGKMLFAQDLIVYLSFGLFAAVYWFFRSSRTGLIVKAVGENPDAANAIGLPVMRTRYLAVAFGGAMAGLAGGYLSLAYTPLWAENMTAGRGWIALALVVFASWRAERVLLGAYLFGLASILHLVAQGLGFAVSPNLLAMLPYVATVFVLVMLSRNQSRSKLFAPVSLGKPFHASS
ncbi:ABC transporter permease [Neptunomonas concharum]|jgi:simple sugar transport system permease protein|uniref:ABC transporter permease n=1 Tax=Neptunomonas concharum TaxID=1031538 RepID=A0A5P1RF17_9GAMM|nr:ABC transporter permease [Neptunomonas concharum]QEQ98249.1 ABC transporter permease [Neptunomonas concharum]